MKISKLVLIPLVASLLISIVSLFCVLRLDNKPTVTTTAPQLTAEVAAQLQSQLGVAISASVKPLADRLNALDIRLKVAETKMNIKVTTPSTKPDPVKPVATKQVRVTSSLNLRSNPGTKQTITSALNNGDVVTFLNESANADGYNWIKVKTSGGKTGWIAKDFVTDK